MNALFKIKTYLCNGKWQSRPPLHLFAIKQWNEKIIYMKRNLLLVLVLHVFLLSGWAQEEYYTSIDGVSGGATLKNALYNLLKDHTRISYGDGSSSTWGAFYYTDRDPATNRVYDMYSGEVRYFGSVGDAISGMNIEHSVAKSWWDGVKNDAYHDLHHLNPSDKDANSRKSNYPLAELESVSWDNGVTFVGKATINGSSVSAFEPCDEYKGDFARTYMYMFTCYQNLTYKYTWMNYENSTYPTFKPWAVELLLKWHKQDPVSQKEIDRNNAVYNIQGNRNPYVDYPQLAEYVWGDSVNYTFSLNGAPVGGGDTPVVGGNVHIMEAFSSGFGQFTAVGGDYPWDIKYNSAHVTSYVSNVNNDAESWLLSSPVDLSNASEAVISFDYVTRYNATGKAAECNCLLISDNYAGDVATATWVAIDFAITENSSDWTFTSTGDIAIPAEFIGKDNITIAFKYVGTAAKAGTWQVKNVVLSSTARANDNTGDDTDDGDDDTGNGGTGSDDTGNNNTGNVGNDGNYPFTNFTLVTDAATLTVGDSIIIAYNDIVMGEQSGKYRAKLEGAVINGDEIISYPQGTQIVVLGEGTVEGSYALKVDGLYLAAVSSSSNNLHSNETLDANSSWAITIASDGAAVIEAQGTYTHNKLQYNTSSPRFSCYTGTQKSVKLYAKSPVSTTSVGSVVVVGENTLVSVYSLLGVCIKESVPVAEALDGLPGGIYLVGGKKVYKQ